MMTGRNFERDPRRDAKAQRTRSNYKENKMKRKTIVTAALVCLMLLVPFSIFSQSQDFEMNGTVLIKYNGSAANVTIPEGVTAIGDNAFARNGRLTSVTIPKSVTSIRRSAFASCSSLISVTIPEGVISIEDYAFYSCTSLASITIPSSVTSIGNGAFTWCRSLTSITVDSQNTAYSSVEGVLFNKSRTILIFYPQGKQDESYTIPPGVTSIRNNAFWFCYSLTSVTIPSSVISIEDLAFSGCESLISITIPASVTSIGIFAFAGCDSLTSVTISRRTTIGENAFHSTARITYSD